MASVRSTNRKLSFEILRETSFSGDEDPSLLLQRSVSDPIWENGDGDGTNNKTTAHRKKKRSKKKKKTVITDFSVIHEDDRPVTMADSNSVTGVDDFCTMNRFSYNGGGEGGGGSVVSVVEEESVSQNVRNIRELRQRNVNANLRSVSSEEGISELRINRDRRMEESQELSEAKKPKSPPPQLQQDGPKQQTPPRPPWMSEPNGNTLKRLETAESLDWKRLMAEDPNCLCIEETSPLKYFMEEMYRGNSLRSTTSLGDEKERESVYDTIFRLPWRCEALIDVGFFVCFNSFLSLLTIMPMRILTTIWKILKTRQFKRPTAIELSDYGCFIVLACGVALLEQTDISLIYHMIRGQGTIKLYVLYNVLEIFDKLCQSFGGDIFQTLFNTAEGLANCSDDTMSFWIWRFISDHILTMVASIIHSFILLAQAITLSTCIVAHNNALLALLVSNNFAEIKSSVFKRFSKDNTHNLVYADSIERFHISAFLLFVLAQNILDSDGPWLESFVHNALMVFLCEVMIDVIKHSFLAKFNDIKPIAYSEFLEELCKQTLNIQTEDSKKNLTFIPLGPACVVIRVMSPVYAVHLPSSPCLWRLLWIVILSCMTFIMLTSLKVLIGMGLQKHATWYVNRCRKRKFHLHAD